MNTDAFAYIPLLCTAVVTLLLGALLIVIKIRNTAKVSYLSFLTVAILEGACLYTVLHPGFTKFLFVFLAAEVLLIPYCVILALGKAKEKEISENLSEDDSSPQTVVEEIKPEEINLIERGRTFVTMAASSFANEEGLQNLLDSITKTCMETAKADGAALLIVDTFEDMISVKSTLGDFPPPYKLSPDIPHKPLRISTNFKHAEFPLRDNIFGEVASDGTPVLTASPKDDDRIFENGPEDFLKLGSNMFIPIFLTGRQVVIGLLALSRAPGKEPFSTEEFNWVQTLIGFAGSALNTTVSFQEYSEHEKLTRESETAAKMQDLLLPKKLPPLPGLSFGSFTEHAYGVCSDAFDVIPARKDRTSVILLDITEKGTNAVMIMTMLRAMFRLVVNTKQSAATILNWANKGICMETAIDHFASVAILNFDVTKGICQFTTAGSTPVYVFHQADSSFRKISIVSEPVGVKKSTNYMDFEFTGTKGDIIITYSDGFIEALNSEGKQYTIEQLEAVVKTNKALGAKEIASKIKEDMQKFLGNEKLHDDQTLLVVKIQ